MSWGTYWGTHWGGVGGANVPPSAWAVSERQVWATVARVPRAQTTIGRGDGLNPASWRVTRLDTGEDLIVIGVGQITSHTFELYTLYKFGPFLVDHRVTGYLVDNVSGEQITFTQDFAGCAFRAQAAVPGGMVDIANPFFEGAGSEPASKLTVTSSGDYANESGVALYRKLIVRRLTSSPNEFFHLEPDQYGLGLKLKEIPTVANMPELRAFALQQLQREPEFSSVKVRLLLGQNGVLVILAKVVVALTNQSFDIPIPAAAGAIQL